MTMQTNDVNQIATHEERELERARASEAKLRAQEEEHRKKHEDEMKKVEEDERMKANAELQAFGAGEIPRILETGERARVEAVERVELEAKKNMPSVLKATVTQAHTSTLNF